MGRLLRPLLMALLRRGAAGAAGPSGSGLLLEDTSGSYYLLLEDGSFLLLES